VLGSIVARDGDDTDVEEVDEELIAGYLLVFLGTPEETFVKVLADDGLLVETVAACEEDPL
jgi:hypothetical protein